MQGRRGWSGDEGIKGYNGRDGRDGLRGPQGLYGAKGRRVSYYNGAYNVREWFATPPSLRAEREDEGLMESQGSWDSEWVLPLGSSLEHHPLTHSLTVCVVQGVFGEKGIKGQKGRRGIEVSDIGW